MVLLIGLDGSNRTGKVVLLCYTVTDDHHFVERLGCIVQQSNHYIRGSRHFLGFITDVRYRKRRTALRFDCEVSVDVTHRSTFYAADADGGTDDWFAGSILHMAIDSYLLCKAAD